MNASTPQPSGSGAVAALEARISRVRQTLTTQQARLARGSRVTAIIGTAVVILIPTYFLVAYFVYLKPQMSPKTLVASAQTLVMDQLPGARRAMEARINESADDWAADLSASVQDNIPKLRGDIEDMIVEQAGKALDEVQVLSAQRFRQFITENQPMLSEGVNSLKKREDAEQFVAELHSAIEKNMSGDLREQSEEMLHTVAQLNQKLAVLKEGKNLKSDQALEREILMLAKRLQRDSALDEPDRPRRKSRSRPATEDAAGDEPATKPAGAADEPAADTPKSTDEPKPGAEKPADTKAGDAEKKSDGN
jgi:hypothetical protein